MYRLRAELRAHTADVRGVTVSETGVIATASRDNTIAIWDAGAVEPMLILRGHSHFVNSVTFVSSETLISASSDKTLRVWDTKSGNCSKVLSGHTAPVCAISVIPGTDSKQILSASWDKTARVWDLQSGTCLRTLAGHEAAVWGVAALQDGRIVTVAADKTVRLWNGSVATILPPVHTDVVRDVVPAPAGGFVTVANDSNMLYWIPSDASFVPAQQLPNLHDGSYIYSVDGRQVEGDKWTFISGGEDNSVKVVGANLSSNMQVSCEQTIMHPGTVWDVRLCPNGDLVSACSDGVARVFTKNADAVADAEILASFEKSVSERQVNTKVIGGVDVAKLPEMESALSEPGKKDGENKIVKTSGGGAEVHMWSAAENKWTKVGDVVDGPGGGASLGPGEVNGKSYDFVFEVEVGEGGSHEKLGYNRGENPYLAAQRFIDENQLNQDFLDQIAQFIEQQVPADALVPTGSMGSDPYTGGSRYVPRGNVASASSGGDPLTGASRYVPGGSSIPPGKLPPPRKLIPHPDGMISYKSTDQLDKIQTKIAELNSELARQDHEAALVQEEAEVFGTSLMVKLKRRSGATPILDDADCAVVEKLLKWPTANVFPVLDVARLVISIPSGGAYFFGKKNGVVLADVMGHVSAQNISAPVYIMGCRFLCNMFGNRIAGERVRADYTEILTSVSGAGQSPNRKARETFASLLINFALMFYEAKAGPEERSNLLRVLVPLVTTEQDEQVLYRYMIAMGTAICGDISSAKAGVEAGVAEAAARAARISPRLQQIALEIATIIAA